MFAVGGGNSAGQTALHMAKEANGVSVLVRGQSLAGSMSHCLIRETDPRKLPPSQPGDQHRT